MVHKFCRVVLKTWKVRFRFNKKTCFYFFDSAWYRIVRRKNTFQFGISNKQKCKYVPICSLLVTNAITSCCFSMEIKKKYYKVAVFCYYYSAPITFFCLKWFIHHLKTNTTCWDSCYLGTIVWAIFHYLYANIHVHYSGIFIEYLSNDIVRIIKEQLIIFLNS